MIVLKGKDISYHNDAWTAEKSKNDTDDFVIIRAGYGNNNIDKKAQQFYDDAHEHGLDVGFYWFSYAYTVDMAKNEARCLLDFVKDKECTFPLVWDYEYDSRNYHYASIATINMMAEAFCETLENAGYFAMIYANHDYYHNIFNSTIKNNYAIWYARYRSNGNKDIPDCAIWQSTSNYMMDGKRYDQNYAYIDFPKLMRRRGLNRLHG